MTIGIRSVLVLALTGSAFAAGTLSIPNPGTATVCVPLKLSWPTSAVRPIYLFIESPGQADPLEVAGIQSFGYSWTPQPGDRNSAGFDLKITDSNGSTGTSSRFQVVDNPHVVKGATTCEFIQDSSTNAPSQTSTSAAPQSSSSAGTTTRTSTSPSSSPSSGNGGGGGNNGGGNNGGGSNGGGNNGGGNNGGGNSGGGNNGGGSSGGGNNGGGSSGGGSNGGGNSGGGNSGGGNSGGGGDSGGGSNGGGGDTGSGSGGGSPVTTLAPSSTPAASSTLVISPSSTSTTTSSIPTYTPSYPPANDPQAQGLVNITVLPTDARITYTGSGWQDSTVFRFKRAMVPGTCNSSITSARNNVAGQSLLFTFTGTSVYMSAPSTAQSGTYVVTIDGGSPVIIDGFNGGNPSATCAISWSAFDLQNTQHTVSVNLTGQSPKAASQGVAASSFELDGFTITGEPTSSTSSKGAASRSSVISVMAVIQGLAIAVLLSSWL